MKIDLFTGSHKKSMTTFFKKLKFCFFGSKPFVFYNQSASLYQNFIKSCSLPIYKPPSDETKRLDHVLKLCKLHFTVKQNDLSIHECLQDIATLELASVTIKYWLSRRNKRSERTIFIQRLYNEIKSQQTYLLDMHCRLSITPTVMAWFNPLYSRDTYKYDSSSIQPYLSEEQGKLLSQLMSDLNSPKPMLPEKSKWHQFCCAAFAAPINLLLDCDCMEYLFDLTDIFFEFARVT